jgi:hypothetical protein
MEEMKSGSDDLSFGGPFKFRVYLVNNPITQFKAQETAKMRDTPLCTCQQL